MILITSACSFGETYTGGVQPWTAQLNKILQPSSWTNCSMGSQGNGLIARKLIYEISQQDDYENILVGIMWSGTSRSEFYTTDQHIIHKLRSRNYDGWLVNPDNFVENDPGGWVIQNARWKNPYAMNTYRFYDPMFGVIKTLEYILYTQLLLEKYNIKYFMLTYMDSVLEDIHASPVTEHLINLINWNPFILGNKGCYEWCKENTDIIIPKHGIHPTSEQHKLFTDQVIIPWLQEKKYI
tara:strand:+ start:675 stop:1391 length:717 start_codon:yes stop_codon:yes gene_type:complete